MKRFICSTLFFITALTLSNAQTIPVGLTGLDEGIRILQLQGKIAGNYSLMARPFFLIDGYSTDSIYQLIDTSWKFKTPGKLGRNWKWEALNPRFSSQYNSDHPYGWNRAGFMQAKGMQTLVSAGIYAEWGPFSAQIKPEYTYAANSPYEFGNGYGNITQPSIHRVHPGQSSFRINHKALSFGISSENLWWGPGIYNALLMSNNAPGFWHITFNTRKPIKTIIGDFEWQIIGGRLVEDTALLLENKFLSSNYYNPQDYGGNGYSGKYDPQKNWRYLSALTISWHPKWVEGLFIGLNRVAYSYKGNIDSSGFPFMQRYFPIIFNAFREDYPYGTATTNHGIRYKQIVSANFRWLFQKSHFELYGEYGVHDNTYNLRDLSINIQHASAFTLGFKKLIALKKNKWIDMGAELTNMAQSTNYLTRLAGYWYQYQGGYTHQNRNIGAGIGGGNNVFTWQSALINGYNKIGFSVQRLKYDPVPANGSLPLTSLGYRETNWTSHSFGLFAQRKLKRFMVSIQLQSIQASNYRWIKDNNKANFLAFLDLQYHW